MEIKQNRRNFLTKCVAVAVAFSSGMFAFLSSTDSRAEAHPKAQKKKATIISGRASQLSKVDIEILQFEAMVFGCCPEMAGLNKNR